MYEFFTKKPTIERGKIIHPDITYARGIFKQEMDEIKGFYRSFPFYLSDSNMLSNIIKVAKDYGNLTDTKDKFVFNVKSRMNEVITSMGLTSNYNYGKMHKKEFFGSNTREFIVAVGDDFDETIPWQELAPLTCLYHDNNGLDLIIPTEGMTNSKRFTFPVIVQINIPMLLWQFRCWYIETKTEKSVTRFVGTYPLLNYMDSHLDIAMVNRFKDTFYNLSNELQNITVPIEWIFITPTVNRYTNNVINQDRRITNAMDDLFNQLKKKRMEPDEFLSCIPTMVSPNALSLLYLGIRPPSRQIEWVLGLARIRYVALMLWHSHISGTKLNTTFKQHILVEIQAILADKTWSMMHPSVLRMVEKDVKVLIKPYL